MLYEIIETLIALIIGVVTAILTVRFEYRKDEKEKLQDRKSMWLDAHYKELCEELNNLIKCITTKNKVTLGKELETGLVKYECNITSINANMKIDINDIINKKYMKHLESGYKDSYDKIVAIFTKEKEYKEDLNRKINEIFKCIENLMNSKFPSLKPGPNALEEQNNKYIYYNINLIYYKLVENIIEGNVKVERPNGEMGKFPTCLYFDEPSNYKIICDIFQNKKQVNELLNNFIGVWKQLNDKFRDKIKNLNELCKRLKEDEDNIKSDLQKIINDFKSGHAIEGQCDVCDKIYNEKDITKLRPKV